MNRRTDEYRQQLEERGAHWSRLPLNQLSFSTLPRLNGNVSHHLSGDTASGSASQDVVPEDVLCPYVFDYGDPETEYHTLRNGDLCFVDRSERDVVVASGSDAVPWLQSLLTNDVLDLQEEGSGQHTFAATHLGRLVAEMRLAHLPEILVFDLESGVGSALMGHLKRHLITEDVRLRDRSAFTGRIGVYGHNAAALISEAAQLNRTVTDLPLHHVCWGGLAGVDVVVQRVEWAGGVGLELSFEREAASHILTALEASSARQDAFKTPAWVGALAFERRRIEAGHPRFGVELDDKTIPNEGGDVSSIAFDKGCYLGQEIIHRLDTLGKPARLLRALIVQDGLSSAEDSETNPMLQFGDQVRADDRKIGNVRALTYSAELQRWLIHAYLKRGYYEEFDRVLQIEIDNHALTTQVAPLGVAITRGKH